MTLAAFDSEPNEWERVAGGPQAHVCTGLVVQTWARRLGCQRAVTGVDHATCVPCLWPLFFCTVSGTEQSLDKWMLKERLCACMRVCVCVHARVGEMEAKKAGGKG